MFGRGFTVATILGVSFVMAPAQTEQRYVILPQSEAQPFLGSELYGLSVRVTGTWPLSQSDVNGPEAKLPEISHFPKSNDVPQRIEHPEKFFRQYLGLLQGPQKLIFLRAYCGENGQAPHDWRDHLIQITGRPSCDWTAIYDVSARRFVKLYTEAGFP